MQNKHFVIVSPYYTETVIKCVRNILKTIITIYYKRI